MIDSFTYEKGNALISLLRHTLISVRQHFKRMIHLHVSAGTSSESFHSSLFSFLSISPVQEKKSCDGSAVSNEMSSSLVLKNQKRHSTIISTFQLHWKSRNHKIRSVNIDRVSVNVKKKAAVCIVFIRTQRFTKSSSVGLFFKQGYWWSERKQKDLKHTSKTSLEVISYSWIWYCDHEELHSETRCQSRLKSPSSNWIRKMSRRKSVTNHIVK